jgi:hypothetical protein
MRKASHQTREEQARMLALAVTLKKIEENDQNYQTRYGLVLKAMLQAQQIGYPTGIRIDPQEPEWPVAYIELPTGQVSWHMPPHEKAWDGHDTPTKYDRIDDYFKLVVIGLNRRAF